MQQITQPTSRSGQILLEFPSQNITVNTFPQGWTIAIFDW